MVSPSFSKYYLVSKEPFIKGAKYYVTVEHPDTGNQRDCRWYSDIEYAKTYGNKLINTEQAIPNLRGIFGFNHGPVLVIRNQKISDIKWLRETAKALYFPGIGWYITSRGTLPKNAPPHFKYLLLTFDEFSVDETHMKKPSEIANILQTKVTRKEWINFVD